MPFDVYVNVYDLTERNKYIYPFGLGVFHTGVEINGVEYAFGGHEYDFTGIFKTIPKTGIIGIKFRESLLMGQINHSHRQIDSLMKEMGRNYTEVVWSLCQTQIPRWINRLAALGTWMPCFVDASGEHFQPPMAPTEDGEEAPRPVHHSESPFDLRNVPPCACQQHPS